MVLCSLFLQIDLKGQNLVPNGDFEVYDTCPNNGGQISYSTPWYSPTTATPDYLNQCSTIFSVPFNPGGYQYARTGVAYAGIACYFYPSFSSYREYIQVQLTDSLIAQKKYCITFYVNLADTHSSTYNIVAITEIGLYLSDNSISSSFQLPLPFIPQITSPTNVYLSDTANWVEVSGNYIAQGGEKFITIGNFKNDTLINTTTIVNNNGIPLAYYYIDDVSVVDCTGVGVTELGIRNIPKPCNRPPHPNPLQRRGERSYS